MNNEEQNTELAPSATGLNESELNESELENVAGGTIRSSTLQKSLTVNLNTAQSSTSGVSQIQPGQL